MIITYENNTPEISDEAFVAESADLIGSVIVEKESSIWYNTVLRGDIAKIVVGEGSNVQDGTVVHVDWNMPTLIGKRVTIGHNAIIHGCTIGDKAVIGMGAVILSGAVIGEGAVIAAGSVVTEGTVIPPGSLVMGIPGKVKGEVNEKLAERMKHNKQSYIDLGKKYKETQDD